MQRTSGPSVRLKTDQLRQHGKRLGIETDAAMASHLGVSQSTVLRLFRGDTGPGEDVIAAALTAFPALRFDDLFEVVEDAGDGSAA